jgi:hypothetical protein
MAGMKGALAVVFAIAVAGPVAAQILEPGAYSLRYSDKAWQFRIDLPGFVLDEQWGARSGPWRMFRAHHPGTHVIVSAFLERNPELSSKEQCRELYWAKLQRSPFTYSDVALSARGDMAFVRAMVREMEGLPVRQQNVHAHLFREGTCIEVHLSKVEYQPADDRLFEAVLRTVRFSEVR